MRRHLAVGALGHRLHRLGLHIAGDDDHGIIRRIPSLIEGDRIRGAEGADLMLPADGRLAIGAVQVEGGIGHLAELGGGVVLDPLAPLLQHHVALRQHHLVGKEQIRHAIGFKTHHQLEPVGRHGLKERGVVFVVKAFSAPPLRATMRENWPTGVVGVPLNMRCSRK
jgi:hypothetical protein